MEASGQRAKHGQEKQNEDDEEKAGGGADVFKLLFRFDASRRRKKGLNPSHDKKNARRVL